jgi:hypothetical protein
MERRRGGALDCLRRGARSCIVVISSFGELFVDFVHAAKNNVVLDELLNTTPAR